MPSSSANHPSIEPLKIQRVTAASAIFEQMKAAIVSLTLLPGATLQEKRIAEEYGVSRTPVREAILRLAEAGLVDIFPQSGTFVSRVPVGAIPEAVVIRKSLEGTTVEAAATASSAADIARLDVILSRQVQHAENNDAATFYEDDEAFHEAIADIAGYPGIWALVKTVKIQVDRARRLTVPGLGRMSTVIAEHRQIRDAIAVHDAQAARETMLRHLGAVIPDIEELRLRHPDYFC